MPTENEIAAAGELGVQLVRLMRLLERTHAKVRAAQPDAVERATYHLLVALACGGPRRVCDLAEDVHSDPSTVSRQAGHLVKLGLVERTADPADGRASLLAASPEGRRVYEENRRVRDERIAEMLAHWSEPDRRQLTTLLARFTTDFEAYKKRLGEQAAVPRAAARSDHEEFHVSP